MNIKRQNISLDTYAQIQRELHDQGMQSYGELILCMAGETRASFMEAVDKLIETGVSRISAHQLMLLNGAPLANPDSRERFGFETRHRIVARCIGNYADEVVVETEEMVVETPTFSFQDYLDTRVFHLLLTIYYYEGNFEEAFRFAREQGLRPFEVIVRMQEILDEAPPAFRRIIADYVRENQEELFDSRSACVAWAEANYDRLIAGEAGGNLLSKYSMIGRFFVFHEALEFLKQTIDSLIQNACDPQAGDKLASIIDYYQSVVLHVPFADSIRATPDWRTRYDIEAWRRDGFERPLSAYTYESTRHFATRIDTEVKAVIESRIATFGEHPAGLGRFTRTMFAKDLRRQVEPHHAPPS